MRVLVVTLGSIGDLLPFVVVGTALRGRGHEVIFASNANYESLIKMAGFEFHAIWNRNAAHTLDDVLNVDPDEAWNRVRRDLFVAAAAPTCTLIESKLGDGDCVVLASWSAFGARLAHERLGVPLCTAYLSPHALSEADMHGRPAAGSGHQPASGVAFFPDWFCPPRPGWPAGVRTTGFPMFDDALVPALPPALEQFLQRGQRPVIFTPGSFAQQTQAFFRESLAACTALDLRAVFLTPHTAQVPSPLPETVVHFKYVGLQRLAERAATLVCHGGIGTSAQAMRAGIPLLATPVFYDQFDNAARIEGLGIGKCLSQSQYRAERIAEELKILLQSRTVKQNCAHVRSQLRAQDPVVEICEIVEALN